MRLDVIKHRRVSLKVPGDNFQENDDSTENVTTVIDPDEINSSSLRERRRGKTQGLRISLNPPPTLQSGGSLDWPPAGSPFSAGHAGGRWRPPPLGDNFRTSEQLNRWIASGDIQPLESLLLSGRSDLLMGTEYKENFIYGHNRSKQFIADLAEYKEKYEQFLEAVVNGDEPTVRQLVNFRHILQSRHPRTHTTTIHLSAIFERPTILRILLEKDRNLVDSRDAEGRSPLHYAAALAGTLGPKGLKSEENSDESNNNQQSLEEEECFDILLDFGANEALLDVEGYTPMNFHRSPHLLDMHQIRGLNQFPLRLGDNIDELITQRNVKALREIVLAGDYKSQIEGRIFPPESRDLAPTLSHLQTRILAIHEAIRNKDQRTLKQLVDNWDTATGKDEHGRTPLHIAVLYGRARMARYLLLLFPRCVDLVDKAQRTSLHYASCLPDEHQRAQMTRILYRAGAEISSKINGKNNKNIIITKKSKKIKEIDENKDEEKMEIQKEFPDIEKVILSSSDDDDESTEEDLRTDWIISNKMGGNKEEEEEEEEEEEILVNDPFSDGDESIVDENVERRVLSIDFNQKQYRQLEQLHSEGLGGKVWLVVKKHLGNEKLVKYIYGYRQAQNRLSQIFGAIELNDFRKLKGLLDEEIVQARDLRGLTPLHIAVLEERHEMVEFIAKQFPAYINISDHLGRTVAHYAAPQQNAIYDTLSDLGADIKIPDKNGFSAERYRANPKQMVRPLPLLNENNNEKEEKKLLNNKISKNGLLSLQNIRNNNISMDEDGYSIFDPDAPSEEQVQRWISLGDVQQLEQLVLDGRAHLLKDKSSTNLASAEFLQGISQYQSKVDSIHKAVEEGDVRRVKSLIDRTMLATARDSHGMTPLHKALLYGQTITVRFLLTKYPHCVNEPDHAGRTALHFAAADSNGEHMIKVLQKAGGDAFIEDKYGHTPFYYRTHGKRLNIRTLKDNAVINQLISGQLNRPLLQDLEEDITDWIHTGNIGKLEELVLNGYADLLLGRNHLLDDVDAISFLEVLPQYQAKVQAIHKAIEQGNLRAVKLLTDRKKLAFCRDSRGLAPLHKSVVFGQTEIAKYLIRNYPQSVNSMDQSKRTPLHYSAALKDGGYMYKLMRKAGADPNTFDCNGRLPKYYLKYPGELNLERMRLDTKQALKQILHTRVAPSYLETNIQQWLREGNLAKLDQLVMSGCGDLVLDKKSNNPEAQIFLKELPSLLSNIDSIHREIREGGIETIKQLITNKRLALARDKHGCTPLHTAIIHEQTEIIRFLAANFPLVLNAPDYNKRTAMHYAAAARDGGHYLKILGKAGADPMAVDNEGRTPDYYRRNAVFDLKLLKERDVEELGADALLSKSVVSEDTKNNYNEEFVQQHGDFPDSPSESADLLSLHSSGVDTGRKGLEKVGRDGGEFIDDGELLEFDGNGEDGIDDGEDAEKNRFEHLLHERLGMPTSDNGLYLARTVAPVLTKALAEVLLRRPANPIGFISDWLVKYTEETEQF